MKALDLRLGRDSGAGTIKREDADWWAQGMLPHYITAALWTSAGDDGGCGIPETSGEFDPSPYLGRFPRAERRKARAEIYAWLRLPGVLDALKDSDYTPARAGHDLWLTRNRHGVGFWEADHCTKAQGETLTAAAHTIGEQGLFRHRGWFYWGF